MSGGRTRPAWVPLNPEGSRRLAEEALLRPLADVACEAEISVRRLRQILNRHLDVLEAAPRPSPPEVVGFWPVGIGRRGSVLVSAPYDGRVSRSTLSRS